MRHRKTGISRWLVHTILFSGLVHLIYLGFTSADSSYLLTHSGEYTIWTLILTLACTPLYILFGWQQIRRFRKILGIYVFLYLFVHLISFIDKYHWQIAAAVTGITMEFNLIIGTISFMIMLFLFLTSNRVAVRRLRKKWKPLHRMVYPAAMLGCGHILLLNDQITAHGFKYSIIVLLLLTIRLKPVKRFFIRRWKGLLPVRKAFSGRIIHPLFLSLAFAIPIVLLILAVQTRQVTASEPFHYERDRGFLTTLFAPDRLPVVDHSLTLQTCGKKCHAAHLPGFLPERSWKNIITRLDDHFGETVNIAPETRDAIETYLTMNAADYTKSKFSIKLLDSIGNQTPSRITETPFFKRHHEDIPRSVIQHESVRRLSNCQACHIGSGDTGNFDDRAIQMPED